MTVIQKCLFVAYYVFAVAFITFGSLLLLSILLTGCATKSYIVLTDPEPWELPGPKVVRTGSNTFEIEMTPEQLGDYLKAWSEIPGTKTYWKTNE